MANKPPEKNERNDKAGENQTATPSHERDGHRLHDAFDFFAIKFPPPMTYVAEKRVLFLRYKVEDPVNSPIPIMQHYVERTILLTCLASPGFKGPQVDSVTA